MKMIRTNALRAIDLLTLVGFTNVNDNVGRERWLAHDSCHHRKFGPMNREIIRVLHQPVRRFGRGRRGVDEIKSLGQTNGRTSLGEKAEQ